MNILFVAENYFPDVMGGSGRVVAEMAQRLAARGHAVTVASRQVAGLPAHSQINGVALHRYAVSANPLSTLCSMRALLKACAGQPSVVVISQPFPGLAVLLSPGLRHIPKVREFYGPWHEEYEVKRGMRVPGSSRTDGRTRLASRLRRAVDRAVLGRMTGIRVLSEYTAKMVRELCPACSGRIRLIPAGVDTLRFRPCDDRAALRKSLSLPVERLLLFTVRNLTLRMGLEPLLDAMAAVVRAQTGVLLLIGGDGPLRALLMEKISRLGLAENVRLLGRIPDEQLPSYFQASDIFILPTQALEGFGLVTLEAMACGTPVLATPQGGTLEILGGKSPESLFRDLSSEAMAEKILERWQSPQRLQDMGRQARQIVLEHYDWDKLMPEYEEYLAGVAIATGCQT